MNIAYLTWFERLNSPIIKSQVIEVLKKTKEQLEKPNRFYFISFCPFYNMIHRGQINYIRKELKKSEIILVVIPSINLPEMGWYTIPIMLLQTFPILLFFIIFKKINILHCRSYPITSTALLIKKLRRNLKIIFDPRSPFPEEKITAGLWNKHSLSYKVWKYLEKKYLKNTNTTIAITNSYVKHFKKISSDTNFIVIPNNVSTEKFKQDKKFRDYFRSKLNINNKIVFVYSGSMGDHWNNPHTYAKFIIKTRNLNIEHYFLFISLDIKKLKKIFRQYKIKSEEYFAVSANLEKVPKYLSVADFGLNLMEKKDIRMSIKTVEYLSIGLPIITNSKVLGAREIVEQYDLGIVLKDLKNINLDKIRRIVKGKTKLSSKCREAAFSKFSTKQVAKKYAWIYKNLG